MNGHGHGHCFAFSIFHKHLISCFCKLKYTQLYVFLNFCLYIKYMFIYKKENV